MLGTESRETYCSHIVGQLSVRNGVGAVRLRASDHGVDNSFQRMGSMIGNGSICSMSRTPSPPQTQTGTDTHTHIYTSCTAHGIARCYRSTGPLTTEVSILQVCSTIAGSIASAPAGPTQWTGCSVSTSIGRLAGGQPIHSSRTAQSALPLF